MSQISEVYINLLKSAPKPSLALTDEADDKIDCFELSKAPLLKALVEPKYAAAKYVHIEHLVNEGVVVLNLSFYDGDGDHMGGAELTKEAVFWDDEVVADDFVVAAD
jgi:hypothetical protein